jgi:signal transduction histidine kinase
VNRSIESLRSLMFELRPYVLDHDGLAGALAVFVQEEGKLPGSATYQVQSRLRSEPPDSVRVILYRITQEALVNVRKHARASHVEITLEEGDDGYTVRVKDDGVGFEPAASSDPSLGHIGLTSMRERASLAGGWFRIESTTGAGTIAEAGIPRSGDGAAA